jgi:organic radical activating enzyme
MSRQKGSMDPALAMRIMDEVKREDIAEKVVFHIMGEPLLHKNLVDILKYGKSLGLTTTLSTNGSLLNEKIADDFIDAGLKKINVSLQTPDAKSWELRGFKGMTFEQYRDRILSFAARAVTRRSELEVRVLTMVTKKRPWLEPYTSTVDIINTDEQLKAVMTEWTNRLYDLAEAAGDMRFNRQPVLDRIATITTGKWQILHIHPNFSLETYHLDSWGNAMGEGKVIPAHFGYCTGLLDHFGVLWDGRVVFCCKDYDGKTALGNVTDSSLVDLINRPEALKAARGFSRYRVAHPYCRVCLGGRSRFTSIVRQVGSVFLMNILRDRLYKEEVLYRSNG